MLSPLLVALALIPAVAPAEVQTTALVLPSGKQLEAELMISGPDRAKGLMFRDSLPEDRVLLFVFERLAFHGIWMKNCRFAIDILWLDEERRIVHVETGVPPCPGSPCPSYQPMRKGLYVVEMLSGKAEREGLSVGDQLHFELPTGT
jgi:uncharacterized membrane protein (UPF0127 family)